MWKRNTKQLAGSFGGGVGRDRLTNRIVFAEWHLRVDAVDGRRGTENKLLRAVRPRQLQKIHRAVDICFGVQQRLLQRRRHARPSRKMGDGGKRALSKDLIERRFVAYVCFE